MFSVSPPLGFQRHIPTDISRLAFGARRSRTLLLCWFPTIVVKTANTLILFANNWLGNENFHVGVAKQSASSQMKTPHIAAWFCKLMSKLSDR